MMVPPRAPDTPTETTSKKTSKSILDRFFLLLERLAWGFTWPVILVSIVMAGLSVWYTVENLTFNTSRSDLISHNLPFDILYKNYRDEFEDFDGMIVVVEGERSQSMKGFAEDLVKKLGDHRASFSEIFYKIDTQYFRDKALLYMDPEDITDLGDKLSSHHDILENVNQSPGLNTLLTNINKEISAGMVDSLVGDFFSSDDDDEAGDDTADLSLLITLLKQMVAQVNGNPDYHSPWRSFLTDREDSLKEEGYLISPNGDLLFILLNPVETKDDFTGSKNAIELIRSDIQTIKQNYPDVEVGLTGGEVISSDEMYITQLDVKFASQIALAGVAFLFIFAYRGILKPLLAVFSLVIALCWSMGYTTLTVGHLNIISVVFTTILIGLGIDFGIHVLERYREERRLGLGPSDAIGRTLQGTGRGNLAGAITTAIAFGSMALTNFIGIAELGVIAAGGILCCWLAMILLLPALVCVEERVRKLSYPRPQSRIDRERWIGSLFDRYPIIITGSVALLLCSAWALKDVRFDYNLLNLQAKGTEAVKWELKIIDSAKRATWYAALVSDTFEEAEKKYHAVKDLPTVGKVDSIFNAIPERQPEKMKIIEEVAEDLGEFEVREQDETFSLAAVKQTMDNLRFKLRKKEKSGTRDDVYEASRLANQFQQDVSKLDPKLAESRLSQWSTELFQDYREKMSDLTKSLHPTPVNINEMPDLLRKRFIGVNGKHLIQVYPGINIWERPAMEQFLREMRGVDPDATGNAVHMFESSQLMIQGYIQGGIYAISAILVFIFFTFRNLRATLLVMVPTLVGSLWTVLFMDLFGVQFNMANLVILPLIIGIGVVNGVHILHRFREEPGADNVVLSKSTGQAVVLSSLTTIIGFGSLMTADHMGVYSLGLVLSLGVGSCLLASITLLPAMLKLFAVRGWKV